MKGMGRIYKRSDIWWVEYWHRGRQFRESSRSTREVDAVRILKKRLKEIGRGRFVGPSEERVTLTDLLDALVVDYRNNGRKSLPTLLDHLKPLRAAFGLDRAVDVTAERIERYKADRLASLTRKGKPVSPATLNRELAALRRAFRLAVKQERISIAPSIELLAEHNARQGFVEPADFEAVVQRLPDPLDDLSRLAFLSGWRKGEVKSLSWPDVDRVGGRIVLRREHSKNEEPRVLPLTGQLAEIIERRWRAREYRTPDGGTALSPYVFHRGGRPVGDFRKAWNAACAKASLTGVLFHDLRRSCVRNMDRAGVNQAVAMKLTGHKTASVYRRYRIVDENDIREALVRTQASLNPSSRTVTPLREIAEAAQ